MYVIVTGGGKVGSNVTRTLLGMGHEVTLIEQRRDRFERLEGEFGHVPVLGDATEIFVLEAAGIARPPDILFAVTGDDEDNLVISQIAREGYGVPKVIARVNDPRNQEHFDFLGFTQTVCATSNFLGLVEHEMTENGLVRMLELRKECLVVVEVEIEESSRAARKPVSAIELPEGSRLLTVMRNGAAEIAEDATVLQPGDEVLAILEPGTEDALRRALLTG
jgi:trk system potassium uptake protein TrkA